MSTKQTNAVKPAQEKAIICGKAKRVNENIRNITINMDVLEKFVCEMTNYNGGKERFVKISICDYEKDGKQLAFVKINDFRETIF